MRIYERLEPKKSNFLVENLCDLCVSAVGLIFTETLKSFLISEASLGILKY